MTRWVVTMGGIGYSKWAPGTLGSVVTLALWWVWDPSLIWQTSVLLVVIFLGIYAAGQYATTIGREDPSEVVIDEFVGMWIALMGVSHDWPVAIAAFLLFRFFDVVKPPPVRQLEALPSGWGIMLDDVAAGLLACASVHLLTNML